MMIIPFSSPSGKLKIRVGERFLIHQLPDPSGAPGYLGHTHSTVNTGAKRFRRLDGGIWAMSMLCLWAPLLVLGVTSITSMGGIGGAFIVVPLLYWLGLPMYEAATLGLLMAFFNMSTACIGYQRGGHIRHKLALAMVASMVVFSPLASYVSAIVNRNIVLLVFMLFLVIGGSMMFFYRPGRNTDSTPTDNSRSDYVLAVAAGALIGFISGLLGVGGGILVGPFLIWRGLGGKDISGTSSLVVVFSALIGFLSHLQFMGYAHVHIDYILFALVVVAAIAGGAIGSHLARFKLSAMQIRRVIGTFEYIMAARIMTGLVGAAVLAKHFF